MAMEAKQIAAHIKKWLFLTVRATYRSARQHPILWGVVISVYLFYRCFPSFFALLISSSPVIACTTVLLGLLLSYGEPNLPEIEPPAEDLFTQQAESLKSEPPVDDVVLDDDRSLAAEAHLDAGVEEGDAEVEEREFTPESIVNHLKVRIEKPAVDESRFESSLGSPWLTVGIDDVPSESESSDGAESSSPDASMADIIPMLEELHPLLDSEPLRTADNESDAGSAEEEQQEEEEEVHADTGDKAVEWTVDDQKNAMDLGISDIERNKRLESLIAKRRARKDLRFAAAERNLIDLDDLAEFQIPAIFAPRQNPFDLPYDDTIPLSAPSVMQPRKNPFDLNFDQVGQSSSYSHTTESLVHGKLPPPPVPPRESFFARHESFSYGVQYPGDSKAEKSNSRLKPFFVVEREGEAVFATYQRQLSEMSDSKLSSIPDSDAVSSVVDEDHQNEVLEELLMDNEVLSPEYRLAKSAEEENILLQEVNSVLDHKISGGNVGEGVGIDLTTFIPEVAQLSDNASPVEEEIRERELHSSIMDTPGSETIEDKYDGSSLKAAMEVSEENNFEELVDFESGVANSLNVADDTMCLLPAGSSSTDEESVIDSALVHPVYDLSPSSTRKSLSNVSSFDEALLDAGLQAHIGVVGSTSNLLERDISTSQVSKSVSEDTDLASAIGGLGQASLDLSSTNKNEAEFGSVAEQNIHPLSLSSVDTKSINNSLIDVDGSFVLEGGETRDASTPFDLLTSSISEKTLISMEKYPVEASSQVGSADSQTGSRSNLPSIPEENMEDYKPEEEHGSMASLAGVAGLTGLQIIEEPDVGLSDIEEPDVGLSDIEKDLFFLQKNSADETRDTDGEKSVVDEPKDFGASVVSPSIPIYDTGLTGLTLLETTESVESSSLLNMSQLEIKADSILRDSGGDSDTINEVHDKQDESSSSDESDESLSEVGGIDGMDEEGLLSELDAVGDFQIGVPDTELHSDGQFVSGGANPQRQQDSLSKLETSGIRTTDDAGIHSEAHSDYLDDLYSAADLPNAMESDVGFTSSSWPSGTDPEMTVYNGKLHLLEASSYKELDSVFKVLLEEADSEPIFETIEGKTEAVLDEKDVSGAVRNQTETDTELRFLEARSIEDINFAFNHLIKGGPENSVIPDVESPESLASEMPLKSTGSHSDLLVVDAETLEDIYSALRQLTDGTTEKPLKELESQHDSFIGEASEMSLKLIGSHSDLEVVDAQTLEDIHSALKKLTDGTAEKPLGETSKTPLKSMGSHSDLQVVDAHTLEDIHSALKMLTDGTAEKHLGETSETPLKSMGSHSDLLVVEAQTLEDIHSALKKLTDGTAEKHLCETSETPLKSMGSHSDLLVVEAQTLEDIHSALKKLTDGTAEKPLGETSETQLKSMGSPSDLLVVEAQTLEDIHSALKKLTDGTAEKPLGETSEAQLKSMGSHSDLHVVDAQTLEDIHSALKELTDGTVEKPLKELGDQHESAIVEAGERYVEPEVLEVQSAEEIRLAFEAAVATEIGSSHGQSGEKSYEIEKKADDYSLGDASLSMIRKKGKSVKSDSSSSSSSSSSDSE